MNNQTEGIKNLDSIIQHFENKDAITKFLHQEEIAKIKSIESVRRYQKDANRGGLIITGKEECNGQSEKILIDFKLGEPGIEQVYDAIYETGKDCSKRIIMFGGVGKNEEYSPATDEYVVGSLISCMNAFPLNLYFSEVRDGEHSAQLYDMALFDETETLPKLPISDLPSKEKFREAEFWCVYYDSLNEAFYRAWLSFDQGITKTSKYGWSYAIDPLNVDVKWTKEGAFFYVKQIDGDHDILKEYIKSCEVELQGLFQGLDLQFDYLPGKLPKLVIKFWDLPINCLMNALWHEKMDYAQALHKYYLRLVNFIDLKF